MNKKEKWDKVFLERSWGRFPSEDVIRFLVRASPDKDEVKVLEVGCGRGANLIAAAKFGYHITGIDISEVVIQQAIELLDSEVPGWKGEFLVGDFCELDLESEYDLIIDCEAVTHNSFEDSVAVYERCRNWLNDEGALFVRTFSAGSWGDKTGEALGRGQYLVSEGPAKGLFPVRFTAEEDFPELFAGFDMERLETIETSHENRTKYVKEWLLYLRKRT